MSYLSATENIGFNVIPQNISEASCATQYKMAVDSVSGVCESEASPYISNGTSIDQTYMIPHINDNFFQSKFKIDPNDLYTFHDSDVIAGEVTVANSEDTVIEVVDLKPKPANSKKDKVKAKNVTNGVIKKPKKETVNGHCKPVKPVTAKNSAVVQKNNGKTQPKVTKPRNPPKEPKTHGNSKAKISIISSTTISAPTISSLQNSISRVNTSTPPPESSTSSASSVSKSSAVTFLDVFMREQGLDDVKVKLEPPDSPPPLALLPPPLIPPPVKDPSVPQAQKKVPTASTSGTTVKTPSKPRRGRGPTHHEALQRISRRAVAAPVRPWHAPGHELFDLKPLSEKPPNRYRLEGSSDEEGYMPNFGAHLGCVEESAIENREQRISVRKAALRRQLALARKTLKYAREFTRPKALASCLKKHLEQESRVPQYVVNDLLMKRGMTSLLTADDKKHLRTQGWSGGESAARQACAHEHCAQLALPCATHCPRHAACSPAIRLFAGCSAVFAGGARCKELLVPLQDGAPLCAHHRAKRDNYDRISRESKPKPKPIRKKPEVDGKKAKRRRRPPPPPPPPPTMPPPTSLPPPLTLPPPRPNGAHGTHGTHIVANLGTGHHIVTLVNGASAAVRAPAPAQAQELAPDTLGADHFIVTDDCDVQELEVEHAASDDILADPSVLSQIPDEAFTEFFNQAEGGGAFEESSELTRALEAVLDERPLDALDAAHAARTKMLGAVEAAPSPS